jgi:hypothetical protein
VFVSNKRYTDELKIEAIKAPDRIRILARKVVVIHPNNPEAARHDAGVKRTDNYFPRAP